MLAPAFIATPPPATPPVLEFKGSRLGMSLAAWRSAPFPGVTPTPVRPVCSDDDPAHAGRLGLLVSATDRTASQVVCTYAFTGLGGPREPVPISDGLFARAIRYTFRGGRLAEISYLASPNAFDALVARIDAQMGPSTSTTRDALRMRSAAWLPRVRMRWLGRAGTVTLTDPVADTGMMAVDYAAPAPRPA